MAFIKLSLILLYRRLVSTKWTRSFLYILATVIVLYSLVALILGLASCVPIAKIWDPDTEGYCVDMFPVLLVCAVLDIMTNLALVGFSLPHVWHHWSRWSQIIITLCIYFIALLCCAFSILRTYQMVSNHYLNDHALSISGGRWTPLELCTTFLAVCLPTVAWPRLRSSYGRPARQDYSDAGSVSTSGLGAFTTAPPSSIGSQDGELRAVKRPWSWIGARRGTGGGRRALGQRAWVRASPGRIRSVQRASAVSGLEIDEQRDGLGRLDEARGSGVRRMAALGKGIMVTTKIGTRTSAG